MKKLLALTLAFSLLFSATACGKEQPETAIPSEVAEEAAAEKTVTEKTADAPKKEDKVTMKETKEEDTENEVIPTPEAEKMEEAPVNPPSMQPEEDHTWEEDAPPAV